MPNAFSKNVRQALEATNPGILRYAHFLDDGTLEVRIPHPAIPCGLRVTTKDDEVSIGFSIWHTHGDILAYGKAGEEISSAMRFITAILSGEQRLVISYLDGIFNDAWPVDDDDTELKYAAENEVLIFGTWQELADAAARES